MISSLTNEIEKKTQEIDGTDEEDLGSDARHDGVTGAVAGDRMTRVITNIVKTRSNGFQGFNICYLL